jgi:hypothetical protein
MEVGKGEGERGGQDMLSESLKREKRNLDQLKLN